MEEREDEFSDMVERERECEFGDIDQTKSEFGDVDQAERVLMPFFRSHSPPLISLYTIRTIS